jgi:spore coat polysaccharide biosynthesis predicted glycosyltransferase SpsG
MLKVKILTEGGKDIGLGHISRCLSLFDELLKRKISSELIINGDVKINIIKNVIFSCS